MLFTTGGFKRYTSTGFHVDVAVTILSPPMNRANTDDPFMKITHCSKPHGGHTKGRWDDGYLAGCCPR